MGIRPYLGALFADAMQDTRIALRAMRKSLGTTISIVLMLGTGIGANVTLASTINRLFFVAPQNVREPDRVVRLLAAPIKERAGFAPLGAANYPMLLDMQLGAPAFEAVAGLASRQMSFGTGADASTVHATIVSDNYFSLLGSSAALGRTFSPKDGFPKGSSEGGPALAVISYAFWSRQFGRDSTALGRAVRIGSLLYSIVGVMPDHFRGADAQPPDLWLPITVAAADPTATLSLSDRLRYSLSPIARIREGASVQVSEQQAAAIWNSGNSVIGNSAMMLKVVAAPLARSRGPDAPREVKLSLWLAGVSVVVLLIACANVSNLLLARTLSRRHEIAVRIALGASRNRLARQMLTESLVLAGISGCAAVVMATEFGPLLWRTLVGGDAQLVDRTLFVEAASVALSVGLVVGLVPAAQSLRGYVSGDLRMGRSVDDRRAWRIRHALLATQSCFCLTLLVGAALFSLSLSRAASLDLGIDATHTVRALVNLDNLLVADEVVQQTYDAMLDGVRSIPGVSGAALSSSDPFNSGRAVAAHTREHDADFYWPPGVPNVAIEAAVGDGFFSAIGAANLRGRDFNRSDTKASPGVAIINSPLATILYGRDDPLGKCIVLPVRSNDADPGCVTVIGVLPGVFYSKITNRAKPVVYVPIAQKTGNDGIWRPQGIFVRVRGDPATAVGLVRRALQQVRGDLPAVRISLVRDIVAEETQPWRVGTIVFGLYGVIALIVAVLGTYSVVAFAVAQRSREIAVRIALGARMRDVLRAVAHDGLSAVAIGLGIGALVTVALRRWIGSLLFHTTPDDPRLIGGIAVMLLSVAVIAVLAPVSKAVRRDAAPLLQKE